VRQAAGEASSINAIWLIAGVALELASCLSFLARAL